MKKEPTDTISPKNFLTCSIGIEGEDLEQADEIDDVLTSTSSASVTVSTPKRSPRSVSRRGPDDVDDSDDDDLGYSRTTHIGDYPTDDDPVDEGESSDDIDILEREGGDHYCPHCGTRSEQSSPNGIPIPMKKPPKRNRSSSTSSFGAGSPPQYTAYPVNDQERIAKISLGFVSLAFVVLLVHSMGNCRGAKELITKSLPWLMQQVSQINLSPQ